MRVIVYDRRPGPGFGNWLLMVSWAVWARILLWTGQCDAVIPGDTFASTIKELKSFGCALREIQFWGHGSAAYTYLNDDGREGYKEWSELPICPGGLVWLRACSVFKGAKGKEFARKLACSLKCRVAGHTRIIGLVQGGLRCVKPYGGTEWWPDSEGELPNSHLVWGPRSVTCFRVTLPDWA